MANRYYAGASFLVVAALFGPLSYAQEQEAITAAQGGSVEDEVAKMDTVVVTTTLRSQTLQDVPMSVGVATSEALDRAGVTSLLDLPRAAPGIVIQRGAGTRANVTVRGLGTNPASAVFESSVGFFVDGVYVPRTREFSTSLFDVERVEVVRGTQGSLLGKNTSSGAVNLITRKPGDEFEADISASREFELESWTVNGGVSIPLSDTLSMRLSGQYVDQGGWVENVVTGGPPGGTSESISGRFVLDWQPSDDFDATLRYENQSNELRGLDLEFIQGSQAALNLAAFAGFSGFEANLDRSAFGTQSQIPDGYVEELDVQRAWLTANWRLGDYLLTSQTGWAQSENEFASTFDMLPGDFLYSTITSPAESFSQEIRLTSPGEDRFRYVIGAWVGSNDFNQVLAQYFNYPPALFGPIGGPAAFANYFDQHAESWSLFAQADYDLTEKLTVNGGVRYTDEQKEAEFSRVIITPGFFSTIGNPPYAPFTLSDDESVVDGLVNLKYDFNEDLSVYIAWAQGTKGGGFSDAVTFFEDAPYDSEVAQTTELGVRYQSADQRITTNFTLFATDITDFQLAEFNGIAFAVSNTDVESRGVESEVVWRPATLPGLTLAWNNTYADTSDAFTGLDVPYAPLWSGSLSANFEHDLPGGYTLLLNGAADYTSSHEHNRVPGVVPRVEALELYSASIGLESDQGYAVRLFGRNLTDENRTTFAFPAPFLTGSTLGRSMQPRTYGVQLSYRY